MTEVPTPATRTAGRHRRTARLVIMGPQGSGKGTQAARIAEHFGVPAISTGELFRTNIAQRTELGLLAQRYTDGGNLVPDDVTDAMVADRLRAEDVEGGFILDGYPRNAAQVSALDEMLEQRGWALDCVIELVAERAELTARMHRRAQIEGRADDTPEAIARRMDIFAEQTAPLTEAYAERGLLVRIDGVGEIDDVSGRLLTALATSLR